MHCALTAAHAVCVDCSPPPHPALSLCWLLSTSSSSVVTVLVALHLLIQRCHCVGCSPPPHPALSLCWLLSTSSSSVVTVLVALHLLIQQCHCSPVLCMSTLACGAWESPLLNGCHSCHWPSLVWQCCWGPCSLRWDGRCVCCGSRCGFKYFS